MGEAAARQAGGEEKGDGEHAGDDTGMEGARTWSWMEEVAEVGSFAWKRTSMDLMASMGAYSGVGEDKNQSGVGVHDFALVRDGLYVRPAALLLPEVTHIRMLLD